MAGVNRSRAEAWPAGPRRVFRKKTHRRSPAGDNAHARYLAEPVG
jgi:hypothetical protein